MIAYAPFRSRQLYYRADPGAKSAAHGMSIFLVDSKTPGFQRGQNLKKIGMKANDTSELFFEDLRVPHSAILGGDKGLNKAFYFMMSELPQERLLIAGLALASAEACFEWTRAYVTDRKAFGSTLLKGQQTVRHTLAEIKTEVTVARAFYDQCLQLRHEGTLDSQMASMAKYWISDLQNTVASRCLQLHGGWGYMWEYPIARAFADARVQPIYGGSNEIMKELIARSL